jgi:uncharacterized protein YggE
MKLCFPATLLSALLFASVTSAQQVQVNRDNRTIAVTVSETVEVDAEIAVVQIGYHNYAPERDLTYKANARMAKQIVDALLASGLKQDSIETGNITLNRVDPQGQQWTEKERQDRQFEADQTWNIRVAPDQAQKVADIAVSSGANELQQVTWTVADAAALDEKASDAALAKARGMAEKMAQTFGGKAGQLLFASNNESARPLFTDFDSAGGGGRNNYAFAKIAIPSPILQLYPQKVRREAMVNAVFALE